MKADFLFRHNVETLLKARNQTKHDLCVWCRRSDAWLSKILGKESRNVPMKYLDRIADFFGLEAYQLFLPGITAFTERRRGGDRRSGKERRLAGLTQPTAEPSHQVSAVDASLLTQINQLTVDERRRFEHWLAATLAARGIVAGRARRAGPVLPAPGQGARTPPRQQHGRE